MPPPCRYYCVHGTLFNQAVTSGSLMSYLCVSVGPFYEWEQFQHTLICRHSVVSGHAKHVKLMLWLSVVYQSRIKSSKAVARAEWLLVVPLAWSVVSNLKQYFPKFILCAVFELMNTTFVFTACYVCSVCVWCYTMVSCSASPCAFVCFGSCGQFVRSIVLLGLMTWACSHLISSSFRFLFVSRAVIVLFFSCSLVLLGLIVLGL